MTRKSLPRAPPYSYPICTTLWKGWESEWFFHFRKFISQVRQGAENTDLMDGHRAILLLKSIHQEWQKGKQQTNLASKKFRRLGFVSFFFMLVVFCWCFLCFQWWSRDFMFVWLAKTHVLAVRDIQGCPPPAQTNCKLWHNAGCFRRIYA